MIKINKHIDNFEIYDYMKEIKKNIWDYLFEDSLAHETIFNWLSELEQIIISRLLFVEQVVSERAMRLWINPNYLKYLSKCIKNLVDTKILIGIEMKKDDNYKQYKMNDKFRFTLLNKIYKQNDKIFLFNYNVKEQLEKEKKLYEENLFPSKEEIFNYSQIKWNKLLHFIASSSKKNINIYFNYDNYEYKNRKHKRKKEYEYMISTSEEIVENEKVNENVNENVNVNVNVNESNKIEENSHEEKMSFIMDENKIENEISNNNEQNNILNKKSLLRTTNIKKKKKSSNNKEKLKNHLFYVPSDSLIEVLKSKKFILNNEDEKKVISISREAFSWFLKDLKSRIVSLVLEYLFIIDNGYITDVAFKILQKNDEENKKRNDKYDNYNNYNSYISKDEYGIKEEKGQKNENEEQEYNEQEQYYSKINEKKLYQQEFLSYASKKEKDSKTSEIYVKETLLLILSILQCNISQPIFLENLTKAQKEFINFGIHIGLFYKTDNKYIFITPYVLLLNMNNTNTQYYIMLLNNAFTDKLCDQKLMNNLSEKYFHTYLLLQEKDRQQNFQTINQQNTDQIINNSDMNNSNTQIIQLENNIKNKHMINHINHNEYNKDNLEIGLIVQSNFKVYLYTSSLLKINILSHLCELQARLPNMVVGLLTRKSVLNAFSSGITANQIIKFLESYSHPLNRNIKSTIPKNVQTQLKLWESERYRLTFEDAIIFKSWEKEFLPYLYKQIVIWAKNKNYLLYYTPFPKNNYDNWIKKEKYLCCIYESKNEVIEKIKEIREIIIKKKENHL